MGPQLVRCGMVAAQYEHAVADPVASMGPQLVRCGMWGQASTMDIETILLQWGRNLFVAECRQDAKNSPNGHLLQWGRNLFVAECNDPYTLYTSSILLQWGRNLFVAEC